MCPISSADLDRFVDRPGVLGYQHQDEAAASGKGHLKLVLEAEELC